MEANRAGRPFLVEAPMENIVVPTPGCWNINDIYTPNELVKEGKLVKKENGQYVAPSPLQVPQRQVIQTLLPKRRTPDCGFAAFLPLLPRRLRPPDRRQGPPPQFFPAAAPIRQTFCPGNRLFLWYHICR